MFVGKFRFLYASWINFGSCMRHVLNNGSCMRYVLNIRHMARAGILLSTHPRKNSEISFIDVVVIKFDDIYNFRIRLW